MKGERFAKLFEHAELGQILVKLDTDENQEPEVRIFFMPEGLGVCSTSFNFVSNEHGTESENAEKAFRLVDENRAAEIVKQILIAAPLNWT